MPNRVTWSRRNVLFSTFGLAASTRLAAQDEAGFKPLFNGTDLTGWEGDRKLWLVESGTLVGRSPGIERNEFLATLDRFKDFILRFQIHLIDNVGNSGVQFRSERIPDDSEMIGYQADVGPGWWGNLYDESRRRVTLVEADEDLIRNTVNFDRRNDYEVYAEGPRIRLSINGKVTAEYEEKDPSIPRSGRIAVQVHSGPPLEVRFGNIRIREL